MYDVPSASPTGRFNGTFGPVTLSSGFRIGIGREVCTSRVHVDHGDCVYPECTISVLYVVLIYGGDRVYVFEWFCRTSCTCTSSTVGHGEGRRYQVYV